MDGNGDNEFFRPKRREYWKKRCNRCISSRTSANHLLKASFRIQGVEIISYFAQHFYSRER